VTLSVPLPFAFYSIPFCEVRWPGGRLISNRRLEISSTRGNNPLSRRIELSNVMKGKKKREISKWVSFSSPTDTSGRTSENYVFTWGTFSSPELHYYRCGEAPSWFVPGRACRLELKGKRYTSLASLPQDAIKLFKDNCPGILSQSTPLSKKILTEKDKFENYRPWYSKILSMIIK
jgi:hypothetical protein